YGTDIVGGGIRGGLIEGEALADIDLIGLLGLGLREEEEHVVGLAPLEHIHAARRAGVRRFNIGVVAGNDVGEGLLLALLLVLPLRVEADIGVEEISAMVGRQ